VDGPRIAPPAPTTSAATGNETAFNSTETTINEKGNPIPTDPYNPALYELAENFKQCVKISSSRAMDESYHGCENLFRDRPIASLPPMPSEQRDEKSASSKSDAPSRNPFRKLRNLLRSSADQPSLEQKPTERDPFGDKAYTLGYAHYAPKTFRDNEIKEDNLALVPSTQNSVSRARAAIRASLLHSFEAPLDYGRATEADYYYQTVSVSDDKATKKRRLAQLKAYCPKTFGYLRSSIFWIPEEEYLQSVLGTMVSFQSNSKGAARAGGIFFFTSDGAYMIKTIPDREKKAFLKMLPDYYDHMKRYGRSSLLTRFCGMYGVTIEEEDEATTVDAQDASSHKSGDIRSSDSEDSFAPTSKEYTFVVMNAIFPAEAGSFVSERFDLKGSTVGREVSREELESKGKMAVLKDLDLSREVDLVRSKQKEQEKREEEEERLYWNNHPRRNRWWGKRRHFKSRKRRRKKEDPAGFTIGATAKAALLSQLRKDVQFLTQCQVMDYSLLVGVVNTDAVVGGYDTGLEGSKNAGAPGLTPEIVESIQEEQKFLEQLEFPSSTNTHRWRRPKLDSALFYSLTTPVRLMLSPPLYVARKTWNTLRLTLDSIVTAPMPYYGSGQCGVYGGKLSILNGKRKGDRAVYYLGLIDFLQPWTTRKVMERKLKGLAGYDTNAISAVTPEEYAARFLEFLDKNIN
jgi:hypothetical protein